MNIRKKPLAEGQFYHIYTKSIASFKIFHGRKDIGRMMQMLRYYQLHDRPDKFSRFVQRNLVKKEGFNKYFHKDLAVGRKFEVQIIAYCMMPTHLHLALKQLRKNGISVFMGNILNSYTRYFNTKHKRKGPLWEGRFKNVHIGSDEQMMHLTRYIHLNPVTARLVDKPDDWPGSSYREYVAMVSDEDRICDYGHVLDFKGVNYKEFVSDRIGYQRELALLKESAKLYTSEVYNG